MHWRDARPRAVDYRLAVVDAFISERVKETYRYAARMRRERESSERAAIAWRIALFEARTVSDLATAYAAGNYARVALIVEGWQDQARRNREYCERHLLFTEQSRFRLEERCCRQVLSYLEAHR